MCTAITKYFWLYWPQQHHSYQLIWPKFYQELQHKILFNFFFILTTAPNMVTEFEYPNWNFDGYSSSNLCLVACFRVILMLGFLYRNLKHKLWNSNIIVDPFFINFLLMNRGNTLRDQEFKFSRAWNFLGWPMGFKYSLTRCYDYAIYFSAYLTHML